MATKCAFIYARISEDKGGRSEGVQAQEKWGRLYAAEQWPDLPVRVFVDNDLSASKDDVFRPEFERMREAIRRGECAHLWSVEQTRLTRIEAVWFQLASDLVRADVTEVHTKRNGVIDVGGVVAGIMAVLGAHEVRQLRKRVTDKMGELAAQGRPAGGACFGYRKRIYTVDEQRRLDRWREAFMDARFRGEDMQVWRENNPRPAGGRRVLDERGRASMEVVPEQAAIIRRAAQWVIDGWTRDQVAAELNRRGLKGVNGGRIGPETVESWLTSPTTAGLRVHQGEIVGRANWEPILDDQTWRAVRAIFDAVPKRTVAKPRRHLLTRLVVCAKCEFPMFGAQRDGYTQYVCHGRHGRGCGRAISGRPVERHVVRKLFEYLGTLEIAASEDEHSARRQEIVFELQALEANRAEWIKAKDAGQLDLGEYLAAKAKFSENEKRLNVELAGLPAPVDRIDPEMLRESWPELPFHRRRQVLEDYIEVVTIMPSVDRPVSLADIAKETGLTKQTVWKAYRYGDDQPRGGKIPKPTRDRIFAAGEKLGFQVRGKGLQADDLDTLVDISFR